MTSVRAYDGALLLRLPSGAPLAPVANAPNVRVGLLPAVTCGAVPLTSTVTVLPAGHGDTICPVRNESGSTAMPWQLRSEALVHIVQFDTSLGTCM